MFVIDKTWGYEKQDESIGYSQICKATRLSKRCVINAVSNAESNRVLIVERGNTKSMQSNRYMFNKHYDTWVTSEQTDTSERKYTRTSEQTVPVTSEHSRREVSLPIKNIKEKRKRDISLLNKKNKKTDYDSLVCRNAEDVERLKEHREMVEQDRW